MINNVCGSREASNIPGTNVYSGVYVDVHADPAGRMREKKEATTLLLRRIGRRVRFQTFGS